MIDLREYQRTACARVSKRFDEGRRAVLLVAPTGSGKTRMGSALVADFVARGKRVLWLAPARELIVQAAEALERAGLVVGIIAASITGRGNAGAPVQVASIQTLLGRELDQEFDLVVFDEAHLAAAAEWSMVLKRWASAFWLGLTATPARADGIGLGALFEVIVVAATIKELTALGHLVKLDIIAPSRPIRSDSLAQSPVRAYLATAPGESAVLFAPNKAVANEMSADFREANITSSVVDGDMRPGDRTEALAAYERGEIKVLCSVGVLTTGWDSPRTSVGIVARRVGSVALWIQMAGRILRPYEGKRRALLLDLAGNSLIEGVGRPDADRSYSLEGRGIRSGEEVVLGSFCAVCGAILDAGEPNCVECGYARPAARPITVVDVPMRKLAADYCAGYSDDQRVGLLRKWVIMAESKGHKPTSVLHKFKGTFRRFPTREELARAGSKLAKGNAA